MNIKDLQALTLVRPTRRTLYLTPLAVQHLDNWLLIFEVNVKPSILLNLLFYFSRNWIINPKNKNIKQKLKEARKITQRTKENMDGGPHILTVSCQTSLKCPVCYFKQFVSQAKTRSSNVYFSRDCHFAFSCDMRVQLYQSWNAVSFVMKYLVLHFEGVCYCWFIVFTFFFSCYLF